MKFSEVVQAADWKAEKHAPVIVAPATVKAGEKFVVEVSIGKEIAHQKLPNLAIGDVSRGGGWQHGRLDGRPVAIADSVHHGLHGRQRSGAVGGNGSGLKRGGDQICTMSLADPPCRLDPRKNLGRRCGIHVF